MRRFSFMFSISLFFAVLAAHFPANTAYAEPATVKGSKSNTSERQVQSTPAPEPIEGTTVKGSKSNSDNREVQPAPDPVPAPEPAEETTVKSSKSNSSE